MSSRVALPTLVAELAPGDFYSAGFGTIFAAVVELHQTGSSVDAVTVADLLRHQNSLDDVGGIGSLLALSANVPTASSVGSYASIIRRESAARKLDLAALEARTALANQADPSEVADSLEDRIRELDRGGRLPDRYWRSWDDYAIAEHRGVGVPLIEGVCNQHTRIILLATEKLGKSYLARQVAFCASAGIHPFTLKPMDPVRVLVVDAENDDDELLPTSIRLRNLLSRVPGAQPGRPALLSAPYGMNLRSRRDRSELEEVLEDVRPQLIIGGPIYKMLPQADSTSDPRHAERLQQIFDDIRKRWGCALLLEHHAPAGKSGEQREIRSIGGQRWAAWPEVTIALHTKKNTDRPDSADVRFPHPPRGAFHWPKRFERGTLPHEWPWIPILRSASDFAPAEPKLDLDPVF